MGLFVRMVLYAVFAFLGGYGFATFDENAMTLTINLEQLTIVVTGAAAYIGTFIAGRIAKAKGGKT